MALRLGNLGLLRHFASAVSKHDSPLSEWRAMRVAVPDIVVADPSGGEVVFYGLEDANVAAVYEHLNPPEWTKDASKASGSGEDNMASVVDQDKASNKKACQEDWQKRYTDLSRLLSKGSCEARRQLHSIARYHQNLPFLREHVIRAAHGSMFPPNMMEDFLSVLEAFDKTAMIVFQAASLATAVSNSFIPTRATLGADMESPRRRPETRQSRLESFLAVNEAESSEEDKPKSPSTQTKARVSGDDAINGRPQVVPGSQLSTGLGHFSELRKRRRTHPLSVSESADHRLAQSSYLPSNVHISDCAKDEDSEYGSDARRPRKRFEKDTDITADLRRQAVMSRARSLSYTPLASDELDHMFCQNADEYAMVSMNPRRLVRKSPRRPRLRARSVPYHHVPSPSEGDAHGSFPSSSLFSFSVPPQPASPKSSTASVRQGINHLSINSSGGTSSQGTSISSEAVMFSGSSDEGRACKRGTRDGVSSLTSEEGYAG